MSKALTLMDGGVGTSLWEIAEEYGVEKVPVFKYNLEQPELVTELYRRNIAAGSKIIFANTFGANRHAVKRFAKGHTVEEIVTAGVKLGREVVDGTDVKLAVAAGPLTKLLEPFGPLSPEECADIFDELIGAGVRAGADLIVLQTFLDLEMMRIAVETVKKYNLPIISMMTFEEHGKTLMGNSVEDIVSTLEPLGVSAIGMNCSMGPEKAIPIIEQFIEKASVPVAFKPNSGLPVTNDDGTIVAAYTADMFLEEVKPVLDKVDYIGGCCNCNWNYISAIRDYINK